MRICVNCKKQGVFGTDKNTGLGYCKGCQWKRTDRDTRTALQKSLQKQADTPQVEKELRFPKKIHKGTFDVSVLDSKIEYVTPTPECFDGKRVDVGSMDEMPMWDNGMDAFWKHAESVIIKTGCTCWNCGDTISRNDFRNSTAHIFPKSIFLSIASHPLNFIVAGNRCGCHHDTHTLLKFSQMSVFGTAVNRYREFCHLITEKHKYHDLFLEYANATI